MADTDLLKEIRETFDSDMRYYKDIRDEGAKDIRYLAGDQWEPEEKALRKESKRPMVSEDQLNQYCNMVVNEAQMSQRDVQVDPGDGGDEDVTEFTADLMRQINYDSDGNDAHHTAFENAVQRSYGVWGLTTEFEGSGWDQKIVIRRFQNPDAVIWDPSCKLADFSDMNHAFVIDRLSRREHEQRFPRMEGIRTDSFFSDAVATAPNWWNSTDVMVAEFWKREMRKRTIFGVIDNSGQLVKEYLDEIENGKLDRQNGMVTAGPNGEIRVPIARDKDGAPYIRDSMEPFVVQRFTNGVEILDKTDWYGSWIPIFPVIGKELWVDQGDGAKRVWLSLIRLARDGQTRLNYIRTCEIEAVGQVPKSKWVVYEGQLEGHETEWRDATRKPITALQVKAVLDSTGSNVLPLPKEVQFTPNIVGMEAGAESAIRAIQSAIGAFNTSIGNTDVNVKSGVAIEKLQNQTQVGAFHFRASYERALRNQGRQVDELIQKLYNTRRDVAVRAADGAQRVVSVNDPNYKDPRSDEPKHIQIGDAKRNRVTIGVGPAYASEMERAKDLITQMVHQSPEAFAKGADIWIKFLNLPKHLEDELVERYRPEGVAGPDGKKPLSPELQKALADRDQMIQALTEKVNQFVEERNAKTQENEAKLQIEALRAESNQQIEALKAEVEKYKADVNAFVGLEKISADENLSVAEGRLAREAAQQQAEIDRQTAKMAGSGESRPAQP